MRYGAVLFLLVLVSLGIVSAATVNVKGYECLDAGCATWANRESCSDTGSCSISGFTPAAYCNAGNVGNVFRYRTSASATGGVNLYTPTGTNTDKALGTKAFTCGACYTDDDGDGWGDVLGYGDIDDNCGAGASLMGQDCDDDDEDANPGEVEIDDGIDNNCNGDVDEGFTDRYWTDMNGIEIDEADVGDTVQLLVNWPPGSEDFSVSDGVGTIVGDSNSHGDFVGVWTITQPELVASDGVFTFNIFGDTSGPLSVNSGRRDSKMNVTVVSPICGSYFDVIDVPSFPDVLLDINFDEGVDDPQDSSGYDNSISSVGSARVLMNFDEGSGEPLDSSGFGNDGVNSGATWQTSGCQSGSCLSFDGSNNVSIADSDVLDDIFTGDYTVSFWEKTTDGPAYTRMLGKGGNVLLVLFNHPSVGRINYYTGGTTDDGALASVASNLNDGDWHHIVLVREGTEQRIYVDGDFDGSKTESALPVANDKSFEIGRDNHGGPYFNGLMDEISIYGVALSLEDIRGIYSAGVAKNIEVQSDLGISGDALSLGGDGEYIEVSHDASLEPATITVSAWIKDAEPGKAGAIVVKRNVANDAGYILWRSAADDLVFYVRRPSTDDWDSVRAALPLDSDWHHVVGTYDGTNLRVFIDGVQMEPPTVTAGGDIYYSGESTFLGIGQDERGRSIGTPSFNGLIDEVTIYPSALDVASIKSMYDAQVGAQEIRVDVNDSDDEVTGTLTIGGVNVGTFGNDGVIMNYLFDVPGNVQVIAEASNTRGKRYRSVSSVMVLDKSVDGDYVAACIDKPKDYENFDESVVEFDASTSRAVRVVGGEATEIIPGTNDDGLLSWYWTFYPEGITWNFVDNPGVNTLAYDFTAEFPIAGDNSATLRLELKELI